MLEIIIAFAAGCAVGAAFHAWFARQAGGLEKQASAEASKVAADIKAKV